MRVQWILFFVVMALFGFFVFKKIKFEEFFIYEETPHGRLVVEFERVECASATRRMFWHQYFFDKSGYTCVSDDKKTGWSYSRYWLIRSTGEIEKINSGKLIHGDGLSYVRVDRLNSLVPCYSFFYGDLMDLKGAARKRSNAQWEKDLVNNHH